MATFVVAASRERLDMVFLLGGYPMGVQCGSAAYTPRGLAPPPPGGHHASVGRVPDHCAMATQSAERRSGSASRRASQLAERSTARPFRAGRATITPGATGQATDRLLARRRRLCGASACRQRRNTSSAKPVSCSARPARRIPRRSAVMWDTATPSSDRHEESAGGESKRGSASSGAGAASSSGCGPAPLTGCRHINHGRARAECLGRSWRSGAGTRRGHEGLAWPRLGEARRTPA